MPASRLAGAAVLAALVYLAIDYGLPYPASLAAPALAGLAAGLTCASLRGAAAAGVAGGLLGPLLAWLADALAWGVLVPAQSMGVLAYAPLVLSPPVSLLAAAGARMAWEGSD